MKFVVPLTIPCRRSTWAAASDSCSTRMTGTTPATAASKRSWTPWSRAAAHSSSPCWESSCLLAVTTCLPAPMARSTYSRAGSIPPMTSTTRSERSRMSAKSPRERVRTPASSGRRPVMCSTCGARASSRRANAPPTVPWPRRPTLNEVTSRQVFVGLAADDDAGVAVAAEHHGRAGQAVVVVGQRIAVGAGGRGDEQIAGPGVVEVGVGDEDVARLAVLAGHRAALAAHRVGPVGQQRLVAGAVEHRPQVVGHAAVDGDPGGGVALDGLDPVDGHAGVGHERAPRLEQDALARAEEVVDGGHAGLDPGLGPGRALVVEV